MAFLAFLAVMPAEPPYRLPANMDFERMVRDPTSTAKAIVKYRRAEFTSSARRPKKCSLGTCGATSL